MSWTNATKKDVKKDFEAFQYLYNFDVGNKKVPLTLSELQSLGIKMETKSTSEIRNTKYTKLKDKIVFYSESSQKDVKELLRHFRNLAAHPQNIRKATINGVKYYRLYDYRSYPPKLDSMKGVVSVDNWRVFKKVLIEKVKKVI